MPVSVRQPVQIAYHVTDPERAARNCAATFGWGPFFYLEHIPLAYCRYRGRPAEFDHSSAYGQAGQLMVEFIKQHNDGPSPLRDLFAPNATGLHHVAHFVPDLTAAVAGFRELDVAIALEARTTGGVNFAMIDTSAELGHMLELYEPVADLARFYAFVRRAAENWDGSDPLRRLAP